MCISHEYVGLNELHFSVWIEQVRADEESDWIEVDRFPRIVHVAITERGWFCGDLCANE